MSMHEKRRNNKATVSLFAHFPHAFRLARRPAHVDSFPAHDNVNRHRQRFENRPLSALDLDHVAGSCILYSEYYCELL